jgi:hypothetical protein
MEESKIPKEMQALRQWALSGIEKAPLSTDGYKIFNIGVNDNTYLLTFGEALFYANYFNLDYGFVINSNDPYTCIDLDVTDEESQKRKNQLVNPEKWTTKEDFDRYWTIIQTLNSYTEISKYGKGIHIWIKGFIGTGLRRDGVEIYSQGRYMICTGNILNNQPIKESQMFLDNMRLQMEPIIKNLDLEEISETKTDKEIIDMALSAENSDKFIKLSNGDWSGYPSQSEADMALMSMFTFYSQSNEQCRRLFRYTVLGQRDKATKDNRYLNNTLLSIRSREETQKTADISKFLLAQELVSELQQKKKQSEFLHTPVGVNNHIYEVPTAVTFSKMMESSLKPEEPKDNTIPWPPGFAGVIARYIYNSAPRPVKEVAIVSALGLIAGICGKGWVIPQSGLNMYIILIARSGVGKEAMHSGIASLILAASNRSSTCMNFVNFTEFASGQALVKTISKNTCFVNVAGEWGRKLQKIAKDDGRESSASSLRTSLTELYQKSGPRSIAGGLSYSDDIKNTGQILGVAFSMIGETTPDTFYECLTPSMMADGFLSRFSIIEYSGNRVPMNRNQIHEPDQALADYIAELCDQSTMLINSGEHTYVQRNQIAAEIINQFEQECDYNINSSTDESWRQMWNRASLKSIKYAANLAVADNFMNPVINELHMEWALDVVRRDIALMRHKIASGDIGISDNARENKITAIIKQYLSHPVAEGYKVNEDMRKVGLITRKYIQQRIASHAAFEKHQMGSARALDFTLRSMVDSGYLSEATDAMTKFNFHGKSYYILDLKN